MSLLTSEKRAIIQVYNKLTNEQRLNLLLVFVELLEEQELVSIIVEEDEYGPDLLHYNTGESFVDQESNWHISPAPSLSL
jgi:hypothetical protein